jgi:protein-disulfide isomerase
VPTDTSRRQTKRERLAARRAAEAAARARAERRRRTILRGVAGGVVVLIALVVVILVQTHRTSTSASAAVPAHTVGGTAIVVGSASAPVTVDLYEDLQCPNCKNFEDQTGKTLAQLVAAGSVQAHYHPMAFLDNATNNRYSTRALNAAAAVLDSSGSTAFQKFHDLLYANQPPESGTGLTDAQLIAYAHQAGATSSRVDSEIKNLTFGDWVKKVTDQASKDGVTATPTVLVKGKTLADLSPAGLTAAVSSAAAG